MYYEVYMAPSTRAEDWSHHLQGYIDYFSVKKLPTKYDILLEYEKRKSELNERINAKFQTIKNDIVSKLITIYEKVPQPTIKLKSVENKLKALVTKYDNIKKYPYQSQTVKNFIEQAHYLFNISYCTCQMKSEFARGLMICSCPAQFKILESEYEFIKDQRSGRKMVITDEIDPQGSQEIQARVLRREQVKNQTEDKEKTVDEGIPSSSDYVLSSRTRKINRDYSEMDVSEPNDDDDDKDYAPNQDSKVAKVKLIDSTQCHTADKKAVSNRALATILKNDANKVNEATRDSGDLRVVPSSKSTVHRNRVKHRETHLLEMEKALSQSPGPFQLMFEGKKINGKERMVVVVQYINEIGESVKILLD